MFSLLLRSIIKLIATRKGRPMNTKVIRLFLLGSLFSLSACVQQSEVRQMKQSVSTLNKEMTQLNKETVKITQQNRLNEKSSSGVYLLPGSKTAARLESQIGTLRMSLMDIAPNAEGTTLTLRIQGESNDPLPAFSGTVEYGQIQGTIDNFQEINVQNQLINAPASLLAPSDVDIPLQLNGITPEQLGFVRIHDIQPVMQ
ncbi:YajI [Escherichia coli H605]|uniref:YajI n=2 Tax=Escherichia TaxID=561 RepID=A0AAJ3U083_ECOLX|nr:YajI [Escherichia coli H605]